VQAPKVRASPEEVEKVKIEIKLSEMEGWPGGSKVGVSGNFRYEDEYDEKEINLKFSLPSYISNVISAKLRLYLFANMVDRINAPGVSAIIKRIEVNGYVISSNYKFCYLGGLLGSREKSTWVEWEVPLQYLRPGINSLTIKIMLITMVHGARKLRGS